MNFMAYFRLSRPINVFIASLAVLIMAPLMPDFPKTITILSAMLVVALLNSAANAVNDITDLDIDKINRPGRPLPSNDLSISQAKNFAIILFIVGNIISFTLGTIPFLISAILATPLMIIYSLRLKLMPFWGNFCIAFILGLAMIYSASAFGKVSVGIIPASFAFLINLIREIVKDIEDMEGDKLRQARTLPLLYGVNRVRIILAGLSLILIIIIPFPWIYNIYNSYFLIICLLFVSLPLTVIFILLIINKHLNFTKISNTLKISILSGLIAIMVGS